MKFPNALSLLLIPSLYILPAFSLLLPAAHAAEASAHAALAIGVLPFENLTAQPEDAWLGLSLAESLMGALSSLPGIQVIERTQIQHLLKELSFSQSDLVDAKQAPALGRMAGAQRLILGSYELSNGRITLRARMLETASGQVVPGSAIELSGSREELPALQAQLAKSLAAKVSAAAPAAPPTEAQSEALSLYHQGLHLFESRDAGKLDQIEALFHQALARDPKLTAAMLGLSRVHDQRSNESGKAESALREALNWARAALEADPGLLEAYNQLAWLQYRLGDDAAQIATYEQALKRFPRNHDLMFSLIDARHPDDGFMASPERMKQELAALGADMSAPEIQAALGIRMVDALMLTEATDYSTARALLLQARQRLPQDPDLTLKLAQTYLSESNPDTAKIYIDEALAQDPDNLFVLITAASLYHQSVFNYDGQPEKERAALTKARDLYLRAMQVNPRYGFGLLALTRIHEALGDPAAAEQAIQQALALKPDDPATNYEVGRVFASNQRYPQAIAALERSRALSLSVPRSNMLLETIDYQLARAYAKNGQPDKALPLLETLRDTKGHAGVAAMLEIELREAGQDYSGALAAYAVAFREIPDLQRMPGYTRNYRRTYLLAELQKRPQAPELLNDLAQSYQEVGDAKAAEDYYLRAVAAAPNHPVILNNLGSFYLAQKQPDKALPHLQAALLAQPRHPKAAYNLAQAYIALGQPELARPLLQQVLAWEPGHAEASATLNNLK